MIRLTEIRLPLDHTEADLRAEAEARLGQPIANLAIFRRGADARGGKIRLVYTLDLTVSDEPRTLAQAAGKPNIAPTPAAPPRPAKRAPARLIHRPLVLGAGPCGLFAAYSLAQMGFRPIILERGRAVRQRTKDTFAFWRRAAFNPASNVQFGEGGAGTFSDGKLWSGIKDPAQLGRRVLEDFVRMGAPAEILIDAKPHIGTFRLVTIVENLRQAIRDLGGEYRFETRVTDLVIGKSSDGNRRLEAIIVDGGETLDALHLILAPGHSARDLFETLHTRGVHLDAKPFSVGVRIEHPQGLIDSARWGACAGHPRLGAADYKLVHHSKSGRSAYSFCMCPGGTVVAATSEENRVVTNGMSQYSRAERNANAGLVVGVSPEDFTQFGEPPLAGIAFQRHLEALAFAAGGSTYHAPAQRVEDFLANRPSTALGEVIPSYQPGITPTDLSLCLPGFVIETMRDAIPAFARRIKHYDLPDAVMTGVETRTSSPIRITRGADFQSLNTAGLYPAGEGAGYAGGILSAAVDGLRVAEAVAISIAAAA